MSAQAAEAYERYVARYILGPWAPLLVDAAQIAVGESVLDVACGTGVVARIAAERVGPKGRVTGIDLNPGMIAIARSLPISGTTLMAWLERSALDLLSFKIRNWIHEVERHTALSQFADKELFLLHTREIH